MASKNIIHVIPRQGKIEVSAEQGNICIEQESEFGGSYETILVAPANLDALIDALKKASQQLLAEGL